MGRLGEDRLNTTPSVTTHVQSPIVHSVRHRRLHKPGHCGGAEEELLGATLYGTARRRPNQGRGPRAAEEATLHNVTKPHRLRTHRDAGRERASGAACIKPEQAPQGATGCGLGWSRGPQVDRGRSTILEQSCGCRTGGATVGSYMCHRSRISITNCNHR